MIKLENVNGYIKYMINEEKGIVTCIYTDSYRGACGNSDALDLVEKMSREVFHRTGYAVGLSADDVMALGKKHIGIAKCSPEDTFDVEIGKALSLARAKKSFYDNTSRVMTDILKRYEDACTVINKHIEKVCRFKKISVEKEQKEAHRNG